MKTGTGTGGGILFLLAVVMLLMVAPLLQPVAHALVENNCRGCHNDAAGTTAERHHGLIASQGKQCLDCHQMVAGADGKYVPVVTRDCIACHGNLIHEGRHHQLINERGKQCLDCHQMIADANGDFTPLVVRDCSVCHGSMNPKTNHDNAAADGSCGQCHNLGLLGEHLSRESSCYTCHSSANGAVQLAILSAKGGSVVTCASCHGEVIHQGAHDGKVVAPYGDCKSCHGSNLVDLHAKGGFLCAACHASSNSAVVAAVQKGLGGEQVLCADCHNAIGGFGNHAGQHDMITLHDATGFIAEHEGARVYCFACHTSSNAGYQKAINDGMAGIPQNCGSCHAATGNQPPIADAGPDATAIVNQSLMFSGADSRDSDGTIVSYVWNFGDGTAGSGVTVTKAYAAAGTYTVTLTVTDDAGASASDTAIVTVQPEPSSGAVIADKVQHLQQLYSVTSYDNNSNDVTTRFRDGNLTDRYLLQNSSGNSYVIAMKLNRDALTANRVVLRLYVSSLGSSRTLRIYPYQSNGTSVNTGYNVSYTVSSMGWKEIDVTSIARRMNGYGWMKFRITPTSSGLYVGEGGFQIQ